MTVQTGRAPLAPPGARRRTGSLVQYALLAGPLLSMLDSSIVNVAVEPIAAAPEEHGPSRRWRASCCSSARRWGRPSAARRDQPALDLSLARQRGPALSMALCALASVITWAAVFLLPVFVQSVQGRSALVAGLAMAPQGLVTGLSTALAPRWLTGLTVRVTVLAGFAVLAVATMGLLLITAATPLWLIAAILAGRSVAIGLVIAPLLQALVQPLRPDQLGDANTLFNTWQRIAGSFGIGLVAALYATRARSLGPVAALHTAGLVLVAIAAAGALGALALPAVPRGVRGAGSPP